MDGGGALPGSAGSVAGYMIRTWDGPCFWRPSVALWLSAYPVHTSSPRPTGIACTEPLPTSVLTSAQSVEPEECASGRISAGYRIAAFLSTRLGVFDACGTNYADRAQGSFLRSRSRVELRRRRGVTRPLLSHRHQIGDPTAASPRRGAFSLAPAVRVGIEHEPEDVTSCPGTRATATATPPAGTPLRPRSRSPSRLSPRVAAAGRRRAGGRSSDNRRRVQSPPGRQPAFPTPREGASRARLPCAPR